MHGEYFVLVTNTHFGVFSIDAKGYPDAFKADMGCVTCVPETDIPAFLLEKVGRNSMAKHDYKWYMSLGDLFCR